MNEQKLSNHLGEEIIDNVDHILSINNYIKESTFLQFPKAGSKIKVVYPGVHIEELPPKWSPQGMKIRKIYREKFNVDDKNVIFFSGKLIKNNGLHLLIKAMRLIRILHPKTILVIPKSSVPTNHSTDDYVNYLNRFCDQIKKNILFTSYIPEYEIPNFLLMSDIFVCSSQKKEPLARVHYEIMASGLPVITSNLGGPAELISHMYNGYLINDYDKVMPYVKAIHYFLQNKDKAAWFAQNSREIIEANFQFQHIANQLNHIYHKILES